MSILIKQVLTDGPALYWTMLQSEVSGTTMRDLSGNGFNGTIAGSPSFASHPLFGSYLNFDGVDDAVSRANDAALNAGTGQYAIEFWLQSSVGTGNYVEVAMRDDGSTGNGPLIYFQITTGALRLWSASTTTPSVGTKRLSDGVLHHVVIQREAGGVHACYIDNVQDTGSYFTGGGAVVASSSMRIAIASTPTYTKFSGMFVHYAWYVGASLSAAQRQRHYEAGLRAGVAY